MTNPAQLKAELSANPEVKAEYDRLGTISQIIGEVAETIAAVPEEELRDAQERLSRQYRAL